MQFCQKVDCIKSVFLSYLVFRTHICDLLQCQRLFFEGEKILSKKTLFSSSQLSCQKMHFFLEDSCTQKKGDGGIKQDPPDFFFTIFTISWTPLPIVFGKTHHNLIGFWTLVHLCVRPSSRERAIKPKLTQNTSKAK